MKEVKGLNIMPYFKVTVGVEEKSVIIDFYEAQIHKVSTGEFQGLFKVREGVVRVYIPVNEIPQNLEEFCKDYIELMCKYNLNVKSEIIYGKVINDNYTYWDDITRAITDKEAIDKLESMYEFKSNIKVNNFAEKKYMLLGEGKPLGKELKTRLSKWVKYIGKINASDKFYDIFE